jgi:hypothetical protein
VGFVDSASFRVFAVPGRINIIRRHMKDNLYDF